MWTWLLGLTVTLQTTVVSDPTPYEIVRAAEAGVATGDTTALRSLGRSGSTVAVRKPVWWRWW